MRSALPKVLHEVARLADGLPRGAHCRGSRRRGPCRGGRPRCAKSRGRGARGHRRGEFHEQTERLGTGHAVLSARDAIARGHDDLLVLFADTPLTRPPTLQAACAALLARAPMSPCSAFARPIQPAMAASCGRRRARRHPRGSRRQRHGARHHLLQWRHHGDQRPQGAGTAWRNRQRQCQGRILPHRCRRDRPRAAASRSWRWKLRRKRCSASTRGSSSPASRASGSRAGAPS